MCDDDDDQQINDMDKAVVRPDIPVTSNLPEMSTINTITTLTSHMIDPDDDLRSDEEIEEMQKCLEKHDKKYCENEIAAKFLNRLIKEGIIY